MCIYCIRRLTKCETVAKNKIPCTTCIAYSSALNCLHICQWLSEKSEKNTNKQTKQLQKWNKIQTHWKSSFWSGESDDTKWAAQVVLINAGACYSNTVTHPYIDRHRHIHRAHDNFKRNENNRNSIHAIHDIMLCMQEWMLCICLLLCMVLVSLQYDNVINRRKQKI